MLQSGQQLASFHIAIRSVLGTKGVHANSDNTDSADWCSTDSLFGRTECTQQARKGLLPSFSYTLTVNRNVLENQPIREQ